LKIQQTSNKNLKLTTLWLSGDTLFSFYPSSFPALHIITF
jgi:hypothetical protein